jgi:hypothetical protein
LEYVIAHELTHGLGFESGWILYSRLLEALPSTISIPNRSSKILAPQFYLEGTTISTARVTGWQPLNVFDSFTFDARTKRGLTTYSNSMFTNFASSFPATLIPFFQSFYANSKLIESGTAVYTITTSGSQSVAFSSSSSNLESTTMYIETPRSEFQEGTSMSHADYDIYANTPDFLMIPAVAQWVGYTLDSIIANVSAQVGAAADKGSLTNGGIYGPATMKVMNALGWKTSSDQTSGSIVVSKNGGTDVIKNAGSGAVGGGMDVNKGTMVAVLMVMSVLMTSSVGVF